uniref:Phylloplanin-like n=1 Tax=Ananas comosus var. bracteatus TaxID=296719 RepID=A0A6V7PC80_ANACO|nr:unnamed protein product [Ananas comosus var. bracteatus]
MAIAVFAGLGAHQAQAQLGRALISGIVPCSTGNLINAATAPVFPNATVQVRCGGNVLASTTTDSNGAFSMSLDLVSSLLSALMNSCNLVVDTPLISCNASLPATGVLQSALQLLKEASSADSSADSST